MVVAEGKRFTRERFQQTYDTVLPQQGDGHHRSHAKSSAGLHIYTGVSLGIVAAGNALADQARTRKPAPRIDAHPPVRSHRAHRCTTDEVLSLRQCDGDGFGAGNCLGALSDQLQHLIQHELLILPRVAIRCPQTVSIAPRILGTTPADLIMQGRESQQCLEGVSWIRSTGFCGPLGLGCGNGKLRVRVGQVSRHRWRGFDWAGAPTSDATNCARPCRLVLWTTLSIQSLPSVPLAGRAERSLVSYRALSAVATVVMHESHVCRAAGRLTSALPAE